MNFDRNRSLLLLVFVACAFGAGAAACTQAGCPDGSVLDGDRCVPSTCAEGQGAYFADADGDGYGDPAASACAPAPGYVDNADDCDDTSAAVNPGAEDVCDARDENCDGVADEAFDCASGQPANCQTVCGSTGTRGCSASCALFGECVPPAEQCNGLDDDCDGAVDEDGLALAEAGPIGSAGDVALGIVRSPAGYVAFLQRENQILAQPLDTLGLPDGDEIPMSEGTPPSVSFVSVAANDSRAYVLYDASNAAVLRSFDLEARVFEGAEPVELTAFATGPTALKVAASNDRVIALALGLNATPQGVVNAISLAADLTGPKSVVPVYTGPAAAAWGITGLAITPPTAAGLPWVATYTRALNGDIPAARMIVGLNALGQIAVAATPVPMDTSRPAPLASAGTRGLMAWTDAGEKASLLQPFSAASLTLEGGALPNDANVTSRVVSLDRAFGLWVLGYVRDTNGGQQVQVALFGDSLVREAVLPSLEAATVTGLDGAEGEDGFAFLVGLAGEQPRVLLLGCEG